MTIDTHTHSWCSDGTQSPTDLLTDAQQAGLTTLGLTDHDTVAGWAEAEAAARQLGMGLLRGMEVSCRYEGISVHMLCYLHQPVGAELTAEVDHVRATRVRRNQQIVERLAADFPITWDDVISSTHPGATIGRPHIADALVELGIVTDRTEAFETLLSSRGPYYVSLPVIDPRDAIRLIHDAGGVAVFAHPAARMRGRTVPDSGMRAMIEAGLDGLEVNHRDNPLADRELLRRRAADHGLIITGSSDYHGTGKPNRLGENTTAPEMLERIAQAAAGVELI